MNDTITPVIQAGASGLTELQQYGIAGIFCSFLLVGLAVAIWHCERRTKENQQAYREDAAANREVLVGLKDTLVGVQIAIAKLEGKLEK